MMTREEWYATTQYDLKNGKLLDLNLEYYGKKTEQARRDLIKRLNKDHRPVNADKLTATRLSKILSGQEYNTYIVAAIIADGKGE